jgi:putative transcriptional regulator
MTIQHHLSDQLLTAYAAGTLPEAFSLAIATHISLCDDCRAALAACEALGGAVLDAQAGGVALSDGALDAMMARLDGLPVTAAKPMAKPAHPVLPAPLVDYVGADMSKIKWRSLGMGVRQAILPTKDRSASARLLYIPAGQAVPDHGHRGMELTLVLQGAFRDDKQRFARGDIEIADQADQHTPVAEAGEDCICLAVTDAPLRFTSMVPRLLQPVFRI